jgi:hypothetical protein
MFNQNLPLILITWMIVILILLIGRKRRNIAGSGLVLAFVMNMSMIHWAASALYLLPAYTNDATATILGTEQSLYGIIGFAFGSLILTPVVLAFGILPRTAGIHTLDPRLPKAYLVFGGLFYVSLSSALANIPSVTSIISTGQELTVVGLGLCWWQAWRAKEFSQMALWLAVSFLPPFLTIVTRGFIGYGAVATLSVLIFISNFIRSRMRVVTVGVILAYLALSVFVTYMRDRTQIRQTVWGGQSLSDRLDRLEETVGTFEFFDPSNRDHLQRIDDRLNQSYLVGIAVQRLGETGDYARGDTLWDAVLALVPRALWPEKTISAGSGDLVTRFTGIPRSAGTSVGIGQVMEFYGNFGTTGVVIGFVLIGLIVTTLDILASERLANNDLHGFVLWYLPGLAFLQVGGQLVEVTASAAASIVVALGVNRYLDRMRRKHEETVLALQQAALEQML